MKIGVIGYVETKCTRVGVVTLRVFTSVSDTGSIFPYEKLLIIDYRKETLKR